MKIGFIGLGKMGKNLVLHLLEQGVEVVVWNRSSGPLENLKNEDKNVEISTGLADLVARLEKPRIVWLMLTAGEAVDEVLSELSPLLSQNDLVIDGGNSFYKDSIIRGKKLLESGIHFMDVGVSGGPSGARNGACLMVGGEVEDFKRVREILEKMAKQDALGHFGKVGAGHFAKMVHNGIEYGMMEAIAEGVNVLKKAEFGFDLANVLRVYNSGSVIESRLVGWTYDSLKEDVELADISSKIEATGEGEWTINSAHELGVDVRVIEDSFKVRQESSADSGDFRAKLVSAMRGKFGGHSVKKS